MLGMIIRLVLVTSEGSGVNIFSATVISSSYDSYVHIFYRLIETHCVIVRTILTVAKEIGRDYHSFGVLLVNDVTGGWISATEQTHKGNLEI